MARYEIHGGNPLRGAVTISGAKNAAVAILPAAILIEGKCRVENVPDISDVRVILAILEDLGVVVKKLPGGVVTLDEERKAAMVSNLLVVLCGNRDAQPIVNSGSLY